MIAKNTTPNNLYNGSYRCTKIDFLNKKAVCCLKCDIGLKWVKGKLGCYNIVLGVTNVSFGTLNGPKVDTR